MTKYSKYPRLFFWAKSLLSSLVLSAALVPHASAHLIVAQHGTLNFKGNGIFMVLSLPVSAFDNIDDDGDGRMSSAEFIKHKPQIIKTINDRVKLIDKEGSRPLQGLLLTPVVPHIAPKIGSKQLVILGRFALASKDTETNTGELKFHTDLFGKQATEKIFKITATKRLSKNSVPQKYRFELTPEKFEDKLFKKKP